MVDTIDHPLREAVQRRRTLTCQLVSRLLQLRLCKVRQDLRRQRELSIAPGTDCSVSCQKSSPHKDGVPGSCGEIRFAAAVHRTKEQPPALATKLVVCQAREVVTVRALPAFHYLGFTLRRSAVWRRRISICGR